VTNNGTITAFDAALVAQKAVAASCVNYHFPVRNATGSDWAFRPTSKNYTPLQGGEDYNFVGVLYGDVTGNWAPPALFTAASAVVPDEEPVVSRRRVSSLRPGREGGPPSPAPT